jgi:hypothetical protein
MPMLNFYNIEISQIAATISAWKRCSIPLYHHFCCSGSCFHLFNFYSFTCTDVQHHFHNWWYSRRLAVTRDKNCCPFRSTWIHRSVYWGSCCSICSFMCNITDYYLSFCPLPFGLCTDLKHLLVFVKFKTCIVLDYWICSWTRNQLAIQHYKNYHNNFSGLFSYYFMHM